jgi:hypothetical protein
VALWVASSPVSKRSARHARPQFPGGSVFDNDRKIITRVNLNTMQPMDVAKIDKKIADLINDLIA